VKTQLLTVAALLACFSAVSVTRPANLAVAASDWPQWRGPGRDGLSREGGLLEQWPKGGAEAALAGERHRRRLLDAGSRRGAHLPDEQPRHGERVRAGALDRGRQARLDDARRQGRQPEPEPALREGPLDADGRRGLRYALGSDGDLACLEAKGGRVRWQKNLRTEFGGQPGEWAYADGHLYIHHTNRDLVLAEATPEGFRERGRCTPPNQPRHKQAGEFAEMAFAYPVIAGGRLYVRDLGTLWAYDIRAGR
jgi:hypothetical protein